jgi:hypothetical protein
VPIRGRQLSDIVPTPTLHFSTVVLFYGWLYMAIVWSREMQMMADDVVG